MLFSILAVEEYESYILSSIIINKSNLSYYISAGKEEIKGKNYTKPYHSTLSNGINFTINNINENNIDVTIFGRRKKINLGQDLIS